MVRRGSVLIFIPAPAPATIQSSTKVTADGLVTPPPHTVMLSSSRVMSPIVRILSNHSLHALTLANVVNKHLQVTLNTTTALQLHGDAHCSSAAVPWVDTGYCSIYCILRSFVKLDRKSARCPGCN